ncbi:UDP-glucosyltransferase 2 [Drosophila grimshawi]|uniref:UDP-glucuronosyltransferase n=1 Tax=Drosophila grimshawi TaxID=7222 RepID=B4JG65_DROGR|nr:UDP-glucosyltransferase 2 [Drosophila grimshawi]XP_043070896.1 UDP-glucosyltransferase 2 [Drosophila grimshawi]EDV93632.1 GH18172 [Drosophila grimshawi]
MRLFTILLLTLMSLVGRAPKSEGAKILATFTFPGRSQYIFAESYLKALAARGHEVTVINAFENKPVPNMRFITIPKIHEHYEEIIGLLSVNGYWKKQMVYSSMVSIVSKCFFQDEKVQQLMKSDEKFDLLIAEVLLTESVFGLAQHFNASLMGFSTYGNDYYIDELLGNISPLSYSPLITSPRCNPMSFYDRLENHFEFWIEKAVYWLIHHPKMELEYAKYFPQATKTLNEVLDSWSLILLGQHFSLSHARPYMPNMIEVGGLHISHKPKPLPADINQFIESSPDGVIYFSLGTNIKSKDLPVETKDTLLKVFSGLKQRVLWKFEDDQLPNKPDNVLISKWFPQPDILAHPKVKLFITHGGLLSTIESIYFGKPVLGLPVFFDQFMNVKHAARKGFGLSLDLLNLKQSELEQTINTLLTTPSYRQAASTLSSLYHDQPESTMDRAIWWTEYVLRHKDASHLRAPSRDMNYVQLHSLDTLAVLLAVPFTLLLMLITLTCWLLRLLVGAKRMRGDKQKIH